MDIQPLQAITNTGNAVNIMIQLIQPVDQLPDAGSIRILGKTLDTFQKIQLIQQRADALAKLRKAQNILKNIAAITNDLRVIAQLHHNIFNDILLPGISA